VVLSNVEVQKALDKKRLLITPAPMPRKPSLSQKCPFATTAVDLRLGSEIVELVPSDPHKSIYLGDGGFPNIAKMQSRNVTISNEQPYHLHPGKFILAKTFETVELPLKGGLAARIEGKSSFARVGLLVHFTAPTIHAGFKGVITLEMANFGPFEIILKPQMYICQLIVETVLGRPFSNESTFQGQTRPGGQKA